MCRVLTPISVAASWATGQLTARADRGCYCHSIAALCRRMDVRLFITVGQHDQLRRPIEAIPQDARTLTPWWMNCAADVAEAECAPFRSEPDAVTVGLIVRKVKLKPTPGSRYYSPATVITPLLPNARAIA